MQELWADCCVTYSKDASNSVGYANFRASMEVVKAINDDTTTLFWGGANEFADMSLDDFFRMFTGALSLDDERHRSRPRRERAGQHRRPQGALRVSCVNTANSPYKGLGCGGGWLDSNINYVAWKGLNKELTWPYTNSNGACNRVTDPTSGNAVKLAAGATRVSPSGNEQALKNALQSGPVGLLFGAESSFLNYRGGIYQPTTCTTSINHAITLVGYGFDTGSSQWFWKIKNSGGTGWGEAGYARIAMIGDVTGVCGMYQWAYKASSSFVNAPLSRPYN
ncbi:hypothetical protein FOA52_015899 [Chlamydomonas sp. UWO 241]|nr:hypothetical protein FOA52_015899 [Chlamydomonas sp. UWO 241]